MIFKIIGSCLVVGACFAAGCFFSKKLYNRRDFLKNFTVFLNSLSTHIRYESSDIFSLVSQSARESDLDYFVFSSYENRSFSELWNEKLESMPMSFGVEKPDKKLLADFGKELGKTDVQGQEKHLELYKNIFSDRLSNAEEAIKQKSKLYKAMGFFAGAATVLMII
ncbi:MAG: stage III sporulation protein AB [Clostridiales bacterium]|nr:stage III sporulation protein AB [Clostridiales bacterium]